MKKYYESNLIELKEKVSSSLCKEIVSFLNADGGSIYIGISDKGEVLGVENIDESCKNISDIITTQIEPNPQEIIKTELTHDSGKTVIRISIQKGINPIYCQKKYGFSSTGCTIRIGTTCREMTQEQIKLRYEKRFFSSDLLVSSPSNYSLLSFKTLKIFYSEMGYHLDDNSFEANLFLRNSNNEYNKLAELMSDQNRIPLVFVKFRGNDKTSISQRSDYGNQCILFAYEQIKNRLIGENICITDTSVRPRIDINLYDMNCVNEALVNAIVHNDWSITEPLISFFSDRIEILSHGGLPHNQTKEQFYKGISRPRNEKLMRIFIDMGIVEHTGHGIPTIIAKYGEKVFDIGDNYINVVIPFEEKVLKSIIETSAHIDIKPNFKANMTKMYRMNEIEEKIVDIINANETVTASDISKQLNISKRTVERAFTSLQSNNIIVRVGSKKTGHWAVI